MVLAFGKVDNSLNNATHRFGDGRALERHGVAGAEDRRL